ncbi:MAG: hypothetical protein KatS3mg057_1701 [Herpetosiphonaceae bacterium]|nr:MAG: hypothetical protein KatS3mg057_1701 [Herpetosiphonaceae bacterium]
MYHRAFALIVVALLMLAGCGGEQIDAQKLALESADAFQTADTFHFQMTVSQGKPAPIDTPLGGLALLSAEGDFKQPQMLRGSLKAQLSDCTSADQHQCHHHRRRGLPDQPAGSDQMGEGRR